MFVSKKKLEEAVLAARRQAEAEYVSDGETLQKLYKERDDLAFALQNILAVTARVRVDGKVADRRAVKSELDEAERKAATVLKQLI